MQYVLLLFCREPKWYFYNENDYTSRVIERATTANEYQSQTSQVIEEALNAIRLIDNEMPHE